MQFHVVKNVTSCLPKLLFLDVMHRGDRKLSSRPLPWQCSPGAGVSHPAVGGFLWLQRNVRCPLISSQFYLTLWIDLTLIWWACMARALSCIHVQNANIEPNCFVASINFSPPSLFLWMGSMKRDQHCWSALTHKGCSWQLRTGLWVLLLFWVWFGELFPLCHLGM